MKTLDSSVKDGKVSVFYLLMAPSLFFTLMDIERSYHVIIYYNAKDIPSDTDGGQTINVLHQFSEL